MIAVLFMLSLGLGPAQNTNYPDLYTIRSIYIGDMGQSDEAQRFRLLLADALSDKGFTVVEKQDQADAVLSGVLAVRVHEDTTRARVTVMLKSRAGQRLWGGDFEPRVKLFVKDTVKLRAEDVASRLRKDWNKSAKDAGVG